MSKLSDTKLTPSANLSKVIGQDKISRPAAVKAFWAYIKAKGLQDQTNKKMINADANLLPLFNGKKQVSMFDIPKIIGSNLH